ncbi:MAG: dTDP-4-dehydrorhamnose reductase [Anaerocolumna sp.]
MERRIIVTGANGQLGRGINQILNERMDFTIINADVSETTAYCPIKLDIANPAAVMNLVRDIKPEIIINCAAHTAVDLCETDQENAYRINGLGPKNLAIAAEALDAKLIHISTDYVFDGENDRPYTELDMPRPNTVYGLSKLQGEEFVKEFCSKHYIIRTAWLYGEGKNFVKTMLSLAEKGTPIRVVNDQYGCPTSVLELTRAINYLMDTSSYGTYHGVCQGITTWYDFAVEIFKLAGLQQEVIPVTSDEYKTAAKRPKFSVLEDKNLNDMGYYMKSWTEALKEYMDLMK